MASDEELAAVNALVAISSVGAMAVGFAASGLIASRFPMAWAFYLDALSFLGSVVCVALVRIPTCAVTDTASVGMVVRNLRAGVRFLFNRPPLRSLFLVSIPVSISFGLSHALLLPFALRVLGATEFEYGLLEGGNAVGFVVGSVLMARLSDRCREGQWIAISYLGMALACIGYSLMTAVPPAIAIFTVSGLLNAPSSIARRLVLQRHTRCDMRGRVNSAFIVLRGVLFLVGMAGAGLADVIAVRELYLSGALLLLAAATWVLFMPGLGQSAAEWRYTLSLLRAGTANIVADAPTTLLQVPSGSLRGLMSHAALSQLFLPLQQESPPSPRPS